MRHHFRRFASDRRAGVVIVGALSLPVLIGVAALVAEFGNALLTRVENQRVADLASYSGAIAYGSSNSETTMIAAARHTAALNGIPSGQVTVTLVNSPKTAGAKAVGVTIVTQEPLVLAQIISTRQSLAVSASALAEVGVTETSDPACILALATSGNGLTLTGGTAVNAATCTVSSNTTVSVPCGTSIRTVTLNYNSPAAPTQPCGGITTNGSTPAPLVKVPTPDPFIGNAAIKTATDRIAAVAALAVPTAPNSGSNNSIRFDWDQARANNEAAAIGCSVASVSGTFKFTCPANKKVVDINDFTVDYGQVDFAIDGAADVVYNFKGAITLKGGSTVKFGPGTYNIAKGISNSAITDFGAGTFNIGRSTVSCGGGLYSICNSSTLRFNGTSTFLLNSGIYNGGGGTLSMGTGTGNSYRIGPSSGGDAFNLAGGTTTLLADASDGGKLFEVKGHVNAGGGGSCLKLPVALQHDIAGNFIGAGAVILGAGTWTVDGYFALANGGASSCDGATVSLRANNVSLVISGKATPSGGNCPGQAFCVAGGYSNIVLTSPITGDMANLAIIGPIDASRTGGAKLSQGGANTRISGLFYFPRALIELSGGASVGGVVGGCFQMVGFRIALSGGTAAASECIATLSGGDTVRNVSLVQ